jgi:hypothetical protein
VWLNIRAEFENFDLTADVLFVSSGIHPEIELFHCAMRQNDAPKNILIGVSKRPCYCCSLFFKEIWQSLKIHVYIVPTDGKICKSWNVPHRFSEQRRTVWNRILKLDYLLNKKPERKDFDDYMAPIFAKYKVPTPPFGED